MRRLSGKFRDFFLPETVEGRPEWLVGSRYEVIRPVELINKTPGSRGEVVKLSPQSLALVLAVRSVEDEGQEVIMGFLAKSSDSYKGDRSWPCGWAQLWRPNEGPKLSCAAAAAWSLGGCYRVKGRPVLRLYADLDTEPLCELEEGEEVLLLDLALAVTKSANEPRLRGKVRTDRGVLGWLTIELPGASALLHNTNMHCKEAVLSHVSPLPLPVALDFARCNAQHRRSTRRAPATPPIDGAAAYPWDVGGVYRTLEKLHFDEGPTLRAGKLVKVEAIRPFASNTGVDQQQLRLNLKVESGTLAGRSGWISTSSCISEAALDVRNHLEFQQVTESPAPADEWTAEEVFTVRLQRTALRSALGVQLRGLEVDVVLEEGALPTWNKAAPPEQRVHPGDRILAVNGLRESTESMISEMKEKEILYVRLLRHDAGLRRDSAGALLPRQPSKAQVLTEPAKPAEPSQTAEEQWKSQRPALAAPAQLIVSKASKESTKIHLAEDAEPEWKLVQEGKEAPEEVQGHCCRDQHCNEDLVLSWLSCGVKRGISVSRGVLEPAPEPPNG